MNRSNLEHLIRAAGVIADCENIIVIGSQSILGKYPNAPKEALFSMEADLIPVEHPDRSDLIDGAIGELSSFHESFGYYADGVDETTAVLPSGWKDRLIPVDNSNTNGIRGLCLEPHDMAMAKLIAGREKDYEVCSVLIEQGLISPVTLIDRLKLCELDDVVRERVEASITRISSSPDISSGSKFKP